MVDVSKIELSALINEARINVKAAELGLHVFSMKRNASDFAEERTFLTQASAALEEGNNALRKAMEAKSDVDLYFSDATVAYHLNAIAGLFLAWFVYRAWIKR